MQPDKKANKDDDPKSANTASTKAPKPEVNARQTMLQGKRASKKVLKLAIKADRELKKHTEIRQVTRSRTTRAVYNH